jgi:hypothetical protein
MKHTWFEVDDARQNLVLVAKLVNSQHGLVEGDPLGVVIFPQAR